VSGKEYVTREGFRSTRIPVEYKAIYTVRKITGEALITDVSEGGVALRVKQALSVGDIITLQSDISNNLTLKFKGEVRNVDGNKVGVMILEIDPELHRRFLEHIRGMLRIMNRSSTEKFRYAVQMIKKKSSKK
jgi:hypothetical protein